MGQYYLIVNIDKRQFLHPGKCGDGVTLLEFSSSGYGTLAALAVLLADGNGRGNGDLLSDDPIVGSWAGDRIVIAGDYADDGKFTGDPAINLYALAYENFEDVSRLTLRAMADDAWFAGEMKRRETSRGGRLQSVYDFAMSLPEPGENLDLALMPANDR